jgi:hypothetical protein
MLPEEPVKSQIASGDQAHGKAEGKHLALKVASEPLRLQSLAWPKTDGTKPGLMLG